MTLAKLLEEASANGALTVESIEEAIKANNVKFADLNEGNYVSRRKYEDDLKAKDTEITGLNETLKARDTDLSDLQTKLSEAGTDAEKLSTLSNNLSTLQSKYDEDTKALQAQLAGQARDFAIREYASTKNFTSGAAKRDYISSMQKAESVRLDKNGTLKGLSDFDEDYSKENADAFVVESDSSGQEMFEEPTPLPQFASPTQGPTDNVGDATGGFAEAFHFTTLRPVPEN